MDLIILRHGEAGNRMTPQPSDYERALTVSGREEVEEIAEALSCLKLGITHFATSPLARAKESAEIAAKAMKSQDLVEVWDELKPENTSASLFKRLSRMREDSVVLLVGHEPYLSGMIGQLITDGGHARIVLKKAGVAKVEITSFAPKPSGELKWLLTPRQLKKLS